MIDGQMTLFNMVDEVLMEKAAAASLQSPDPSTKTGCVLATADGHVLGSGYNAFPRGVEVTEERLNDRAQKYPRVVHAEINAILAARLAAGLGFLNGFTAYMHPWPPCAPCAAVLIQAGCTRIVARHPTEDQIERWGDSFVIMESMLIEAGVKLDYVN